MLIVEKLSQVAKLLIEAAKSEDVLSFVEFHALFDKEVPSYDRYDTLEAASRALCPSSVAIYSAVMARNEDGYPGTGFYDIFKNARHNEFNELTGHGNLHELTGEDREAIAEAERVRVYKHAK
jgi:hypothetical protein